jgi:hypothetical protein
VLELAVERRLSIVSLGPGTGPSILNASLGAINCGSRIINKTGSDSAYEAASCNQMI